MWRFGEFATLLAAPSSRQVVQIYAELLVWLAAAIAGLYLLLDVARTSLDGSPSARPPLTPRIWLATTAWSGLCFGIIYWARTGNYRVVELLMPVLSTGAAACFGAGLGTLFGRALRGACVAFLVLLALSMLFPTVQT